MTDLDTCPTCGGPADNSNDRCLPPSAYECTKCEGKMTDRNAKSQARISEYHGERNVKSLRKELSQVLNRHSSENESDTPDFILAEYLLDCLRAFDRATRKRAQWYGGKSR